MRGYDLFVIYKPEIEEQALEDEIEKVSVLLKDGGGRIAEINRWGKKPLGHQIQGEKNGTYVVFRFESEPSVLPQLRKDLGLNDYVLRHRVLLSRVALRPAPEETSEQMDDSTAQTVSDSPEVD